MTENEILFIDRTIKHIRRVQDNMILLQKHSYLGNSKIMKWSLLNRAMYHDLSKFSHNLVKGFVKLNDLHRNNRLGKFNGTLDEEDKKIIKRHREIESHHAHCRKEMSELDLCEMCCDLSAISQEFEEKDYTKYFKEKLIKEVPMLEKYKRIIIKILELLQRLNNIA